jgi:hypothetical protein
MPDMDLNNNFVIDVQLMIMYVIEVLMDINVKNVILMTSIVIFKENVIHV